MTTILNHSTSDLRHSVLLGVSGVIAFQYLVIVDLGPGSAQDAVK
jgi:hypothetical protein